MPGARSTTEWTEVAVQLDLVPASSPDEILAQVAEMAAAIWLVDDVFVGIAGTNASGTVVGYARTTLEGEPPLRGVDLRFDMRNDAGPWEIVAIQRRFHCAGEMATDLCSEFRTPVRTGRLSVPGGGWTVAGATVERPRSRKVRAP